MQEHAWYAHVGTACQIAGCGYTTTNEAAMRVHLTKDHDRTRRVSPAAGGHRHRHQCGWDPCGQTFSTWMAAIDCFHKHQALAFAAAAPAQEQQQKQEED